MKTKLVVVIRGGNVEHIYPSKEGVEILDMDDLESQKCPLCSGVVEFNLCQDCETDWSKVTAGEIASQILSASEE